LTAGVSKKTTSWVQHDLSSFEASMYHDIVESTHPHIKWAAKQAKALICEKNARGAARPILTQKRVLDVNQSLSKERGPPRREGRPSLEAVRLVFSSWRRKNALEELQAMDNAIAQAKKGCVEGIEKARRVGS